MTAQVRRDRAREQQIKQLYERYKAIGLTEDLSEDVGYLLLALEDADRQIAAPRVVYLVDGGDYENFGWHGVYVSLEAAMADNPLPEMRAIPGKQIDPTCRLQSRGGWRQTDKGEWWNGFDGDFGTRIHAVELKAGAAGERPDHP